MKFYFAGNVKKEWAMERAETGLWENGGGRMRKRRGGEMREGICDIGGLIIIFFPRKGGSARGRRGKRGGRRRGAGRRGARRPDLLI